MDTNLEVGQRVEIDGRVYWVARILDERNLELMPDPDNAPFKASGHRLPERRKQPQGSFWPTFWVIALIIVLFKLIF